MALIPKDVTPVYKATIAKGTNAMRWQWAVYVDLLPPRNNAYPAGHAPVLGPVVGIVGGGNTAMDAARTEQIRAEDTEYAVVTEYMADCHPEAATYSPELPDYRHGVSGYLETLRQAAEALDIPVIASLNGISELWCVRRELPGSQFRGFEHSGDQHEAPTGAS
jgi:hypothetical protein